MLSPAQLDALMLDEVHQAIEDSARTTTNSLTQGGRSPHLTYSRAGSARGSRATAFRQSAGSSGRAS